MARDIVMDVVTRNDSRGLRDAANALDRSADSADSFTASMQQVSKTSADLDRQLIATRRRVTELGDEFVRTGDRTLLVELNRNRSTVRQLERIKGEMVQSFGDGGSRAGVLMADNITGSLRGVLSSPIGLGVAAGAAAALAVPVAAAVAGAVVGAVGVGGIIGGVVAASRDPQVRAAASQFGDTFEEEFFGEVGDVFAGPTARALGVLESTLKDMDLAGMLAPAAKHVETLAQGVAGFAAAFGEGFGDALANAGPFVEVLAQELPEIGDALGDLLRDLSESEGALEAWRDTLEFVEGTIRVTGVALTFLADRFDEVKAAAPFVAAFFNPISAGTVLVNELGLAMLESDDTTKRFMRTREQAADAARAEADAWRALTDAIYGTVDAQLALDNAEIRAAQSLDDLTDSLKDNGATFDINTDAGRDNLTFLYRRIDALDQMRQDEIDAGGSVGDANRKFNEQIAALHRLLASMGLTEAQINDLIGAYENIPRRIVTEVITKVTTIRSTVLDVFGFGRSSGRAGGGSVYAGQIYRVNETGQEFFQPAMDGRVIPTAPVGSQAKGNAGTGDMNVTVFAQFGSQTVRAQSQRVTRDQYWRDKRGYY